MKNIKNMRGGVYDIFNFENVAKEVGKISKILYGINPYPFSDDGHEDNQLELAKEELTEEEQEKLALERNGDLEDLEKDNQLDR